MPWGSGEVGSSTIPAKTAGRAGPDSPLELSTGDWKATLRRTAKEIKQDRVSLVAAGMAFYWFLAIFPALIAAVGILDLANAGQQLMRSLSESISSTLPSGAGEILTEAIADAQRSPRGASLVAAVTGVAIALWSATSGMVALQDGLNVAYDVDKERKFVKKRLIALGLIVAVGVLGGVPSPLFAASGPFWSVVAWLVTVVDVVTLFAVFYYLAPNRQNPDWKWVSPGGLIGAVIWVLVSLGFSFYVTNFGKYGQTYGPLAGVVILIFWLYLSALAILVGGELNAELERQAVSGKTG